MAPDKRSLKILTDMFWSSSGWKRDRSVTPDDFAYAKSHGVMFDPIILSHDHAVEAAVGTVSVITREAVARAFVSSLGGGSTCAPPWGASQWGATCRSIE